ncbi:hypothetical protein SCHPADRAFT_388478 [Schizopora paradoxa]|uniref:Uncharacterized protein n=1 Tax=Schizopora paradoxa TaxID=27342 RepID=A0A0H2RN33_9AGAM|nr:hypothetical protein SCHPADRAFT_388478 [Schizopora paradoxa]
MFVKFPAAMQIILNASAGCTLTLRTYALYYGGKWVLIFLLPIVVIGAVVESWALTMGVPASLSPGIVGCILTGNPADGNRYAVYWISQLIFPTLIFAMTVYRVLFMRREGLSIGSVAELFLRDGLIYFAIIFLANLVNVVTFVTESVWEFLALTLRITSPTFAQQTAKQKNAPFSEMIIAVMICRLTLNMRSDKTSKNWEEVYEMSEFHCASRNLPGNASSSSRSPRSFGFRGNEVGDAVVDRSIEV